MQTECEIHREKSATPASPTHHPRGKRGQGLARWRRVVLALPVAAVLGGCSVAARLDYAHPFDRRGWQRTEEVIAALGLRPGDRVADLGAGNGYFSFFLADAVGPAGRVYAVDIDRERTRALRAEVTRRGVDNIEVILADPEDSGLPSGIIDLVFLCNAYHHFEDRVPYFTRLGTRLAPGARIAIIDGKSDGGARIFLPHGHWMDPADLRAELLAAGYRHTESRDFLPLQSFDLFAADAVRDGQSPVAAGGQ